MSGMIPLLLEMVRRMGSVGAQHHRTDGEGRSRLNDRVPAGSALGRSWSAATELGADFPVPLEKYREILRFRPRHGTVNLASAD
jgi:hypothetical protein